MYFLNLTDISDVIIQALRSLMGDINASLYTIVSDLYAVFIYISKAEIIEQSFIKEIYTRVGTILGIFMVFKLIFSLIQSLIDPEKLTDKKSGYGAIIGRSVLAIVLLGITPSLFREAFKLQNLIVGSDNSNNVIYKLIAGRSTSGDFYDLGRNLSSDIYFSFFSDDKEPYLNEGILDDIEEDVLNGTYYDRMVVENYANLVKKVEDGDATFSDTVDYLAYKVGGNYVIEFNWIPSLIFAVVLIWFFVTYCIQIGIRVIQLAYLQLISPIPILSYISDPDGAFKKWIKQCTTTFLDLFFRLAIIYFIMTIVDDFLKQFNDVNSLIMSSTGLSSDDGTLDIVKMFIIIGLFMFAKRVPDLLKDLFPNMGGGAASLGFGIKSPKKTLEDIPLLGKPVERVAKAGIGAGLVGVGALAANGLHAAGNIRKTWKDNKGQKGRFRKTLGAGTKGMFSMVGGALGGAKVGLRSGLKDNKVANFNKGVSETNDNREKRELAAKAGYRWYNAAFKSAIDKVEAFAGDTTEAEKKIKTAQFRQQALQNSQAMQWHNFAEANKNADLSLLRSMQEFTVKGRKVWKGIDSNGDEREFILNGNVFESTDGNHRRDISDIAQVNIVRNSATIDEQLKEQGKIIKGLEKKKNDAEGNK